jgi:hypothetical protein
VGIPLTVIHFSFIRLCYPLGIEFVRNLFTYSSIKN